MVSQVMPARARVPRAVSVRCQVGASSTTDSASTSGSKCPFSGIMKTSKGLLQNSAAAPTLEESPTTTSFVGQKFDYTPFSGPNYQVCMHHTCALVPVLVNSTSTRRCGGLVQ